MTTDPLGYYPDIQCAHLDLMNIDQTAHVISQFQPNTIFCSATLQKWGSISTLPEPLAHQLYEAQMGPWLPLHLTLVYRLMQAVQQTGLRIQVVNATYPDVVNTVLGKVNLAPTTGIGDLANNIPALRLSIAFKLEKPVERVDVRFFAQRYLSYRISRAGNAGGAPFHLTILVDGENLTHLFDVEQIFTLLPTVLRRAPGHLMTAASAAIIMNSLINGTEVIAHVPGPKGLPGGYPIRIGEQDLEVILPQGLGLEGAIRINQAGQRLDGIERIGDDGTVYFAERNMAILKKTLGYECRRMPLSDVEEQAKELRARFLARASRE